MTAQVWDQNNTVTTLASNTYDVCCLTDRSSLAMHDSAYTAGFLYRGNLSVSNPANHTYSYDIGGVVTNATDGISGITSSANSSTNYSLPATVSNGNTSTAISYAATWAVTQVTDTNNGATSTTTYDSYGRPQTSTSSDGMVTNYTYTYSPPTQTATINNPPENPSEKTGTA